MPSPQPKRLDELFAQFAAQEPESVRNFLAVPEQDTAYLDGSTVRAVTGGRLVQTAGSGLVVPESALRAPIDYFAVYLTLDEYIDISDFGDDAAHRVIAHLLASHDRRTLIQALARLNRVAEDEELQEEYIAQFKASLTADTVTRLENTLREGRGPRRFFFARQPLLHAMKLVLTADEPDAPTGRYPPDLAAGLLAHAVAKTLHDDDRTEGRLGGLPRSLAMELIQNLTFNANRDVYSLIVRTAQLWRQYGERVERTALRASPTELFREACGLEIEDTLALGFGFYTHAMTWKLGNPSLLGLDLGSDMDPPKIDSFLAECGKDLEGLAGAFRDISASWNFLPFQSRPILCLPEGHLVLDARFMLERVTSGLFWTVHDHEKTVHGDRFADQWRQAWAEMIEVMVEDRLRAMAPPVLGSARSYFNEDHFGKAYGGQRADAGIDFGDGFLLVEVVSGQLSVPTRAEGSVEAFEADTERLVVSKARQLNATADALLQEPARLLGSQPPGGMRVTPVIVVAGGYPNTPVTHQYIHDVLDREGILRRQGVSPLAIIDLEELEMVHGLYQRGDSNPLTILGEWQGSALASMPLKNFILERFTNRGPDLRPTDLADERDNVFESIVARLKLRETLGEKLVRE